VPRTRTSGTGHTNGHAPQPPLTRSSGTDGTISTLLTPAEPHPCHIHGVVREGVALGAGRGAPGAGPWRWVRGAGRRAVALGAGRGTPGAGGVALGAGRGGIGLVPLLTGAVEQIGASCGVRGEEAPA
jgi:hypothetical protein